ncbi:MAG: zinc-ribbon and DUF3426 domain-containing protein [Pseudomonadota bacterium]
MASDQFETRCPECQTVFSVAEAELSRADGRVRCGDCLTVFDAREHLLPIETFEQTPDAAAPVEPTLQVTDEVSVDTTAPTPVNELRFEDGMPEETLAAQLEAVTGNHEIIEPDIEEPEAVEAEAVDIEIIELDSTTTEDVDLGDTDWDDLLSEIAPAPPEPSAEASLPEADTELELEPELKAQPESEPLPEIELKLEPQPEPELELELELEPVSIFGEPPESGSDVAAFDLADSALRQGIDTTEPQPLDFQLADDDAPGSADDLDLDLSGSHGTIESLGDGQPLEAPALDMDLSDPPEADDFNADAMASMLEASDIFQLHESDEVASADVDVDLDAPIEQEIGADLVVPDIQPSDRSELPPEQEIVFAKRPSILGGAESTGSTDEPTPEHIILETEGLTLEAADQAFAESMLLAPEDVDPSTGRWRWLAFAATLILGVQLVHAYRNDLATHPAVGTYVSTAYDAIGAPLQPNWDPRAICTAAHGVGIEDDQLRVETGIINRGTQSPPFPILQVRLTDPAGQTLSMHIIPPDRYLDIGAAAQPLTPGAQIIARASLEVDDPALTEYRLALCYPDGPNKLRCAAECRTP